MKIVSVVCPIHTPHSGHKLVMVQVLVGLHYRTERQLLSINTSILYSNEEEMKWENVFKDGQVQELLANRCAKYSVTLSHHYKDIRYETYHNITRKEGPV